VLVVVVVVSDVTVPLVHVVDMVTMRHLLVAATRTVRVGVLLGPHMHVQHALVVVLAVPVMHVPVVQVVHVVPVLHPDVAATVAVGVLMG
jgi:hypothetical protein